MATQQEYNNTKPSTPLPVEDTNQTGELVYQTPDNKYLQYMNKCYIDIQETTQPDEMLDVTISYICEAEQETNKNSTIVIGKI